MPSDLLKQCLARDVLVSDADQLRVCHQKIDKIGRLYIESDLLLSKNSGQIKEILASCKAVNNSLEIYLALPFIIRLRDETYLEQLQQILLESVADGCLIRNIEELGLFTSAPFSELPISLALDSGMYAFQKKTIDFYKMYADTVSLSYELNGAEKRHLMREESGVLFEQVVFGRIPMMITANCLAKTAGECTNRPRQMTLTDRYHHDFPVQNVCKHCYNIIWNCLPMSLHTKLPDYKQCLKRIQFTTESVGEAEKILDYFLVSRGEFPVKDYTTGHEKRGVE